MLNILVALLGTAYVAYTDWKTGYMPDKVTHAMIAFGIIWALLFMQNDLVYVFGLAAVVFIVGFLAYIFGQLGGGDVKLFTAIALLLPSYPKELVPILNSIGIHPVFAAYPFILAVFLFAGLLGPMFFTSISYLSKLYQIRRKVKDYQRKVLTGVAYSVLFIPIIYLYGGVLPSIYLIFLPMVTAFLLIPFKNDVLEQFSIEEKDISKLNDDDIIALEFLSESTKKKLNLWRKTFTSPELKKIKEAAKKVKIKRIKVYENLPKFGPYILISLIVNLILGDVFLYVLFNSLA